MSNSSPGGVSGNAPEWRMRVSMTPPLPRAWWMTTRRSGSRMRTLTFDRLERPLPSEAEGDRFESCQVRPTG